MALSTDNTWKDYTIQDMEEIATFNMELKNSSQVYYGSLVSHDTDQGGVKPFDGTQTDRLVGWHWTDTETGDTSATPKPTARIKPGGFVVTNLAVTGLAGTVADQGAEVYASDDGTYTIVDPGSGIVVGRVVKYVSSSVASVYMRNFLETIT